MRNLLAFFGAALVTFAGLGWYLDWYKIRSDAAPSGHHNVNIDLNSPKIISDVHKGVEKGEEKLQKVLDKDPKGAGLNSPSAAVPPYSPGPLEVPPSNDPGN